PDNARCDIATIQNTGNQPIPANTVIARLYNLTGLDYLHGDTGPTLPALAPNQTATFQYWVQPTGNRSPLVTSLSLIQNGSPIQTRVLVLQHLTAAPPTLPTAVPPKPLVRIGHRAAYLENNRIGAVIFHTSADVAGLSLYTNANGVWRLVGTSIPLGRVLSGVMGARSWWDDFNLKRITSVNGNKSVGLVLNGTMGLRWTASLTLTLNAGSSVILAKMTLSPFEDMTLERAELSPLLAGDRSYGTAVSELVPPQTLSKGLVTICRWGDITSGVIWHLPEIQLSPHSSGPSWRIDPIPSPAGADFNRLAAVATASGDPVIINRGDPVTISARIFTLSNAVNAQAALSALLGKPKNGITKANKDSGLAPLQAHPLRIK
ncbi:MAG: hypothetical protein M1330_05375, partial [Armatimonadetes bacterium]|nr:hypothetical protein [Armatimonadota bacterium]